jgi:hypothetical protein
MIRASSEDVAVSLEDLRLRFFCFLRTRGYEPRAAALVADVFVFCCIDGNSELVYRSLEALQVSRICDETPGSDRLHSLECELRELANCIADPPSALPPTPSLRFVRAHKLVASLEGRGTDMTLVLSVATRTCLDRVAAHGIALVSAFGTSCAALGSLGYFARWIALNGYVAVLVCGSSALQGRYSRMRVIWGVPRAPAGSEPLIWDCYWDDHCVNLESLSSMTVDVGLGIWPFMEFLIGPLVGTGPSTLKSAEQDRESSMLTPWGALIVALDRRLLLPLNFASSVGSQGAGGTDELMHIFERGGTMDPRANVMRKAMERAETRAHCLEASSASLPSYLWSFLTDAADEAAASSTSGPDEGG